MDSECGRNYSIIFKKTIDINIFESLDFLKKIKTKRIRRRFISLKIIKPLVNFIISRTYNHLSNPEKVIIISIDDIYGWYKKHKFDEFTYPGIIKGGNWDSLIKRKKLKDTANYRGLFQRFKEGLPWKDTILFRNKYSYVLKKGKKVRNLSTLEEIEKYYKLKYDKLYNNIKRKGITYSENDRIKSHYLFIHIYKNGEILWTPNGNHRLSICSILGFKKIPVKVWMRHKEWQEKRERLLTHFNNNPEKISDLKKHFNHPDIVSDLILADN